MLQCQNPKSFYLNEAYVVLVFGKRRLHSDTVILLPLFFPSNRLTVLRTHASWTNVDKNAAPIAWLYAKLTKYTAAARERRGQDFDPASAQRRSYKFESLQADLS